MVGINLYHVYQGVLILQHSWVLYHCRFTRWTRTTARSAPIRRGSAPCVGTKSSTPANIVSPPYDLKLNLAFLCTVPGSLVMDHIVMLSLSWIYDNIPQACFLSHTNAPVQNDPIDHLPNLQNLQSQRFWMKREISVKIISNAILLSVQKQIRHDNIHIAYVAQWSLDHIDDDHIYDSILLRLPLPIILFSSYCLVWY